MPKYYIYPFGVSGDRTSVPDTGAAAGPVNYNYGYGLDYSLPLSTNPAALAIPRVSFNQVVYDITSNIQQYQQHGVPEFITSSDNGGTPYAYAYGAKVRYNNGTNIANYTSKTDANTALPTNATYWTLEKTDPAYLSTAQTWAATQTFAGISATSYGGTWNGNIVTGQYGGTGVANTGKTITLGGNLTTSGAYNVTFTATNTTSVTLPTSGTLVGSADSNTVTNAMLAQAAANTIKGNNTASTANETDIALSTNQALGRLSGNITGISIGTEANNLVQLDGSARLPAVNGSQLTNLNVGASPSGILPVANGGTGVSASPLARAYQSVSQSITTSTFTKITLDTKTFDTNTNYDTSTYRFTPTVAGKYAVSAAVLMNTTAATYTMRILIYKNGAEYSRAENVVAWVSAATWSLEINDLVDMNGSTDYLEIYVWQNSGANRTTSNGSTTVHASYSRIG